MDMAAKAAKLSEMCAEYRGKFPAVPVVQADKLYKRIKENDINLVVVDTRTDDERKVSVIPGHTLSQSEFEQRQEEFKQSDVVCYCTIGLRSARYAQQLRERGFEASNLEGSILKWTHAQLPLVEEDDRAKETKRVHVYGPTWALQADGYEPVAFQHSTLKAASSTIAGIPGSIWGGIKSLFRGRNSQ